jgi:hypothetical protein
MFLRDGSCQQAQACGWYDEARSSGLDEVSPLMDFKK